LSAISIGSSTRAQNFEAKNAAERRGERVGKFRQSIEEPHEANPRPTTTFRPGVETDFLTMRGPPWRAAFFHVSDGRCFSSRVCLGTFAYS
jgi:hypothetical protein